MIRNQLILDINDELIVDNFAGGGGASTGIELALGRHVDLSWNHDPEAVAMHQANHPQTRHYCQDVFDAKPVQACAGRPVGLAWFSPDCKHFSKAKGGKPRSKKIRGLAWVVIKWAATVRPRVIILENVEEFQTWGPLRKDGSPCPKRKGRTFAKWCAQLRNLKYTVEWRELRACDYGAPTIRKRLFLIARCDGRPIVWPTPTHAAPDSAEVKTRRLKPWRTAAECIDWTLPCPSIFTRRRPLAPATCRRIAKGIMRYVVNNPRPFIVPLTHHDKSDRVTTMSQPLPTVTAANRGEMALVAPVLTEHANQKGGRTFNPQQPLRTQCAEVKGGHFAMVQAFLAKHYGGAVGSELSKPIGTVTSTDHHSLVATHLTKFRTGSTGSKLADPLHTVTAGGEQARPGTGNAMGLVATHLTKLRGTSTAQPSTDPLHTISAGGNHFAEVCAFLIKYYGTHQAASFGEPLHTITAKHRFGLVTVNGEQYEITDIGLRMLAPRELFRAQGFPENYIIGDDGRAGLRLSKSSQVRMCGNSVCPPLAAALVRSNVPELATWSKGERKIA